MLYDCAPWTFGLNGGWLKGSGLNDSKFVAKDAPFKRREGCGVAVSVYVCVCVYRGESAVEMRHCILSLCVTQCHPLDIQDTQTFTNTSIRYKHGEWSEVAARHCHASRSSLHPHPGASGHVWRGHHFPPADNLVTKGVNAAGVFIPGRYGLPPPLLRYL